MLAIKHSHFESWDIWGFNVIKMVNAEKKHGYQRARHDGCPTVLAQDLALLIGVLIGGFNHFFQIWDHPSH